MNKEYKNLKQTTENILNSFKKDIIELDIQIYNQKDKEFRANLKDQREKLNTKISLTKLDLAMNIVFGIGFLLLAPILAYIGYISMGALFELVTIMCVGASALSATGSIKSIKGIKNSIKEFKKAKKELEEFEKNPQLKDFKKSKRLLSFEAGKEKLQEKYDMLYDEYKKLISLDDDKQFKNTKKAKSQEIKTNTTPSTEKDEKTL